MQKLINLLYRYPVAQLKKFRRFGGYFKYRKIMAARKQMENASFSLPAVTSVNDGLPVYFLTGKKYIYQTLFCIHSLVLVSKAKFRFVLVDDGTFDDYLIDRIKKQLPGCTLVTANEIEHNLKCVLPIETFPNLHRKRKEYPHIKKLTDIHTIQADEWKLVLDSDMLFWSEPTSLIAWLNNPQKPLYMVDCVEAYGYTHKLMKQLADAEIKPLINVGAVGLNSKTILWQQLDNWIEILEKSEGKTYYLEQALTAMLIGNKSAVVLNKEYYLVNPAVINDKSAVLHHYVDLSKKLYFLDSWKHFVNK